MKLKAIMLALAPLVISKLAGAEDFMFDASEFEKKKFEFSGYLEQKQEWLNLDPESSAYKLAYPGESARSNMLRSTTTLETAATLNMTPFVADIRAQANYVIETQSNTTNDGKIMEGGGRWSAGPGLTLDLGKRVQRWGKGYAWNPVGFVERPKDPNDPQLVREGFLMASGEWTKSYSGPISTLGATGLLLPTNQNMNGDFGKKSSLNPAVKLYMLLWDTDVDVMWRGKGARPQSFGLDFSRNITTAWEIHGEWARTLDAPYNTITATGESSNSIVNYNSYLLGFRYLTQNEITLIGEYYRNGSGHYVDDMSNYYQFIDRALHTDGTSSLVNKALAVAHSGYDKANLGLDYLYWRASANEPFDWLYVTPALTVMSNLNDGSYQVTSEVTYTGYSNIELRARFIFFDGHSHTEFAEKVANNRLELYARWFF